MSRLRNVVEGMRAHGRSRVARIALMAGLFVGTMGAGAAYATFSATTTNTVSLSAAADLTAPISTAQTLAPTAGTGTAGFVAQGGTFYVYANVTDTGNPASGIASVTANVQTVSTGQSAVPLSAGSFSVAGVSYNYRSSAITAANPKAEGTYSYSIASTDNASNSRTQSGFTVTVDNTRPTIGTTTIALTSGATVSG